MSRWKTFLVRNVNLEDVQSLDNLKEKLASEVGTMLVATKKCSLMLGIIVGTSECGFELIKILLTYRDLRTKK